MNYFFREVMLKFSTKCNVSRKMSCKHETALWNKSNSIRSTSLHVDLLVSIIRNKKETIEFSYEDRELLKRDFYN